MQMSDAQGLLKWCNQFRLHVLLWSIVRCRHLGPTAQWKVSTNYVRFFIVRVAERTRSPVSISCQRWEVFRTWSLSEFVIYYHSENFKMRHTNKLTMVRPTFPILRIPLVGQQDGTYGCIKRDIILSFMPGFSITCGKFKARYVLKLSIISWEICNIKSFDDKKSM